MCNGSARFTLQAFEAHIWSNYPSTLLQAIPSFTLHSAPNPADMPPGSRGRAGKFSKPTRGGLLHTRQVSIVLTDPNAGGKKFSKNLTPLDADGNPTSMWGVRRSCPAKPSFIDQTRRTHVMRRPSHPQKKSLLQRSRLQKRMTPTSQR